MTIIIIPDSFSFSTEVVTFAIPEYDSFSDLTSLPSPWSTFGTVNFQSSGMVCQSTGSGITYAAAPQELKNGTLVDMEIIGGLYAIGEAKIYEFLDINGRKVSVNANFATKEIWIDDGINIPPSGFRPLLKERSFFLRITTSELYGKLIARMYVDRLNASEAPMLQQTVELVDDPDLPIIGPGITIGRITGDNNITFRNLGILTGENPDTYYPFPIIDEVSPLVSELNGGNNISTILNKIVDLELGSENFRAISDVVLSSIGGGNTVITDGKTILGVNGIGTATAQFINSFNGDMPSGADISISLETDQALINIPPQQEVVLAAAELRAGGQSVAIELVSDSINHTLFRVISKTETVTSLNSVLLTTTSNSHIIRFVRAGIKLTILINGSEVISLTFRNGVGLFKIYSKSTSVSTNFLTYFTDFVIKPVLVIGENIAKV